MRSVVSLRSLSLSVLLVVVAFSGISMGQYKELPMKKQSRKIKDNVLKGAAPLNQFGKDMVTYYKSYLFPAMTREDQSGRLTALRLEVLADLARAKSPEARAAAYSEIFKYANGLAGSKNFRPATRYNALLLLGQLNKKESGNTLPQPDTKALAPLVKALSAKDDEPMLKFAAVQGILRHAEICGHPKSPYAFKSKARSVLAARLLTIVNQTEPSEGVQPKAHAWLQTRAVEALGHLRVASDDVVTPLKELLIDESAEINLRCAAAEALGRMAKSLDKESGEELIGRVTKLLVDSSNLETMAIVEILSPSGRMGGRVEGRGYAGPRGGRRSSEGLPSLDRRSNRVTEEDVADPRSLPIRRRHLYQLTTIRRALAGDSRAGVTGLKELSQTNLKSIIEIIDKMIEDIQNVESELKELGANMTQSRGNLVPLIPAGLGDSETDAVDAAMEAVEEAAADESGEEAAPEPDAAAPADAVPEGAQP